MTFKATTKEAIRLLTRGSLALANVELYGMAVDTEYCKKATERLTGKITDLEKSLDRTSLVKKWRKVYGSRFKLGSNEQLNQMLYKHLKYKPTQFTNEEETRGSVQEEALLQLGIPDLQKVIRWRRLKKTRDTYLNNILRETVDGVLHPSFDLSKAVTFRSSCTNPNFQNMPIRNPEMSRLIRRAIIPRRGRQIMEIDFGRLEVCVSACYNKDPTLLRYIKDPKTDMHRDMALQLYKLLKRELGPIDVAPGKHVRYCAKNKFVFPEFYGSYWKHCATSLWNAIRTMKLATAQGLSLKDHLANHGIRNLAAFELHVQEVEDDFWNNRFQVYTQWKEDWYERYLRRGWFEMKTGFVCSGVMGKNDVINYPVQGAAFHCLLWSLIELDEWLRKNHFKSHVIGQIHDSLVNEIWPPELEDVVEKAEEIMTRQIVEAWKWIIVPLEIDVEVAPVGLSWHKKKKMKRTTK